jgi:hypothetical protein
LKACLFQADHSQPNKLGAVLVSGRRNDALPTTATFGQYLPVGCFKLTRQRGHSRTAEHARYGKRCGRALPQVPLPAS